MVYGNMYDIIEVSSLLGALGVKLYSLAHEKKRKIRKHRKA